MKILMIVYCLVIYSNSCTQRNDNLFIERVTDDFSRSSYYILINIKSGSKTDQYLMENDDFFYYFHQQKGYTEKQYQEFIRSIIGDKRTLTVSNDDIKKYGFIAVRPSDKLTNEIKKGKNSLLQ